jgi:hypothetical protein
MQKTEPVAPPAASAPASGTAATPAGASANQAVPVKGGK